MDFRTVSSGLAVFVVSLILPIFGADWYLKSQRLPASHNRVMLLGGGSLKTSSNGVRTYTPSTTIRHAAVYGPDIEYDYYFTTDKHGFRQTFECDAQGPLDFLVIAGDSFTEGQGSDIVWTTDIQETACRAGINTINTAIAGSGLLEMEKSLVYAKESLKAHKAIIAIIVDDIYRPYFKVNSNTECSSYSQSLAINCGFLATWWHIPFYATSKELLDFAEARQSYGVKPAFELIYRKAIIGAKQSVKKIFFPGYQSTGSKSLIEGSVDAVNRIANLYGVDNMLLLILPSKEDRFPEDYSTAQLDRRKEDFAYFKSILAAGVQIFDIRACSLGENHFYPQDAHPNALGQTKMNQCIHPVIAESKFFNS